MRTLGPARARTRIRALAISAIALTTLLLLPAASASAADLLPDLIPTPPTNPQLAVTPLDDGQDHFLLRFDAVLRNAGPGPLEIRGSSRVNDVMTDTWQRIYQTGSGYRDDHSRHPDIRFQTADGHDHWHVQNAARYGLWNETGSAEVGRGAKVGFCLEDVEQFGPSPGHFYDWNDTNHCGAGEPNASSTFQGITQGWQDVYVARLPFQWVDVSDIAPGRYRLSEQVDPDNFALEEDEANNGPALADEIVTLPGWVASPGKVNAARPPTTILLGAQQYGSPGAAAFKIESAPKHGKLSSAPGAPPYQFIYTPNLGFEGTDTFTFSAHDASSPFPLHAPVATVSVKVPGSPVRALKKMRLLSKLRWSRKGRVLTVRARARKSGTLKIQIRRGKRALGSCTERARAKHAFRCRIKLRRHASAGGAKAVVKLLVKGRPTGISTYKVPRRLPGT